jgi:hypothetical protein
VELSVVAGAEGFSGLLRGVVFANFDRLSGRFAHPGKVNATHGK